MINPNFPDSEYDSYPDEQWITTQNQQIDFKKVELQSISNLEKSVSPGQLEWFKKYRRPINEIVADLSKNIPSRYLRRLDKSKGGGDYLPWHTCCILLDRCAPGWEYSITQIQLSSDRIFIVARITIQAEEGNFSREATGTEELKRQVWNKDLQIMESKEHAYGDPSSNAESMALRRAAAKFGLALYLYEKD